MFGATSWTRKGCSLDPQSGHIPSLWVRSLVGAHIGGNRWLFLSHIDVSLSVLPPTPSFFSKNQYQKEDFFKSFSKCLIYLCQWPVDEMVVGHKPHTQCLGPVSRVVSSSLLTFSILKDTTSFVCLVLYILILSNQSSLSGHTLKNFFNPVKY